MQDATKVRHTVDAQFGRGAHRSVPAGAIIERSRRTGRIRGIRDHNQNLLCTLRPDGGLAITVRLARLMLARRPAAFASYCVEVSPEAAPFVEEGRSVFCRHVVRCGSNVRAASDVPVTCGGRVIAVGKALLSRDIMSEMGRGVAVKVRDGLKGRGVLTKP